MKFEIFSLKFILLFLLWNTQNLYPQDLLDIDENDEEIEEQVLDDKIGDSPNDSIEEIPDEGPNENLEMEVEEEVKVPVSPPPSAPTPKAVEKSVEKIEEPIPTTPLSSRQGLEELEKELPTEEFSPQSISQNITLKTILEQGLRKNPQEKTRAYAAQIIELEKEQATDQFWLPNLRLQMINNDLNIFNLASKSGAPHTSKTPAGSLGLVLGDYTIFNWGKDQLDFQSRMETLTRQRESLAEDRRNLKHNLIILYFKMILSKEIERISKDQVRHATFVYRISREKAALKKISRQNYFQTRALYLKKQQEYAAGQSQTHTNEKEMAYTIGDTLNTLYRSEEKLKYKRLRLELEEALRLSLNHGPQILDQATKYNNSNRYFEKTLKDVLPLPKLSINLGSYLHQYENGKGFTAFNTSHTDSENRNIELKASLNMTWDILGGERGFLNSRQRTTAYYQKMIAKEQLMDSQSYSFRKVREIHQHIKRLEDQMVILPELFKNDQKKFDEVVENFLAQKSSYQDLSSSLEDLKNSEILLEQTKYEHLVAKIELAKIIGVEDFPAENFENLATFGK